MKCRIKMDVKKIATRRWLQYNCVENTRSWFAFLSFASRLFKGQVQIWIPTDDLQG